MTEDDGWFASFPVDPDGVLKFGQRPVDPGGTDLGNGVRLAPAHRQDDTATISSYVHRIYRSDTDIGGVDYQACSSCRAVVLGEIGLIDTEQRRGIGTRVLAQLREELPGYRWSITPEKKASRPFWARIRVAYPGEYLLGARENLGCAHMLF